MNQPARLDKKQTNQEKFEDWLFQHAHIILPLALIILLLLIGAIIGVMVSGGNMTMSEANTYYYHLEDSI